MHLRVDLAAKNLRCTGHGELGDLVAQRFLGSLGSGSGFLLGSLARGSDDARSLGARLVDDGRALLLGSGTELPGGFTRLAQFVNDLLLGEREIGLRLVRSRPPTGRG